MGRIQYYSAKIKRAWSDRTLADKAKRFLIRKIKVPFEVFFGYLKLPKADRRLALKDGFSDHRQKKNHHRSKANHLERIITAYRQAKKAHDQAGVPFQIHGVWAEWIFINFKKLIAALESGNVATLSALLENFHREQCSMGMGGYDFFLQYRALLGSLYLKYVWSSYRDKLLSLDVDVKKINFPLVGNPTGILLNGQVISIETLRHAYHAVEMAELFRDFPKATIAEIGGGLGGQAYQTMHMNRGLISKYLIFDIPEVVAMSSYFLLSAFPDKRIRLFGEGVISTADTEKYDIAILPHFAVAQLPELSVDLFYNSCSFSEIDGIASKEYLAIIERAGRKYFLHDNHDTVLKFLNPDGSFSVNIIGSKLIPNPVLFKRIYKKPRVHGLPEDSSFRHYEYLYERVKGK